MEPISDETLIRRTLAGSRVAYGQLVARYQDYVFTVCVRVLRQREWAEEAAQDTFLKAYQKLEEFKGDSRLSSWLYTIAYRTALDQARLKQLPVDSIDGLEQPLQVADTEPTPYTQLAQRQLNTTLQTAINHLHPEYASIITLYYLHEQSVQEIAEITGLTSTNVKTRLHRSREQLRRLLNTQLKKELTDWL